MVIWKMERKEENKKNRDEDLGGAPKLHRFKSGNVDFAGGAEPLIIFTQHLSLAEQFNAVFNIDMVGGVFGFLFSHLFNCDIDSNTRSQISVIFMQSIVLPVNRKCVLWGTE